MPRPGIMKYKNTYHVEVSRIESRGDIIYWMASYAKWFDTRKEARKYYKEIVKYEISKKRYRVILIKQMNRCSKFCSPLLWGKHGNTLKVIARRIVGNPPPLSPPPFWGKPAKTTDKETLVKNISNIVNCIEAKL